MDRRTAPNHAQLNIPLQTMGHSEPEEDDDGYVHSSRLEGGASACPAEEAPRRPSVPFHTRNLIRQLPSRNLDDLSAASEPHAVLSEHPRGDVDGKCGTLDTGTDRRRQRDKWRYLTLRMRAAAANKTGDMDPEHLYNILRADAEQSGTVALETLRDFKQSLTLKRSVKRRLTSSRADSSAHQHVAWWRRTRYGFAMGLQRVKYSVSDLMSHLDLWHSHLKDIQGNFGSGVTSYFLFLRRMFLLNILMSVLLMGFVTVPQIIYDRSLSAVSSHVFRNGTNVGYVGAFVNIFTGAGLFADSVMYYGHYTNETLVTPGGTTSYDMPLAYLFTMAVCLLCCLVFLTSSLTRSYKHNYIELSMGVKDVFSAKVFSAWDFSIESRHAATLKSRSIYNELKELLSMEQRAEERRPLGIRVARLLARVVINMLILAIMAASGWLVYYLLDKNSLKNDIPVLSEMTVALVVGALCFVLPTVFLVLSEWECIDSVQGRLYLNLARVTLFKVILLGVLMYFWLSAPRGEGYCWESRLGQEVYRLLLVDTAFVLLLTTGVGEVVRSAVYKHLTTRVGPPEMDIAHNTLDLIYTQTLVWVGLFYCPLLPLVGSLKLLLTFYVKRLSVMCTQPSMRPWRAVHAQTVFLALTFVSFVLSTGALGYAVIRIKPSAVCGPFKQFETTYGAVLQLLNIELWATRRAMNFIFSPFIAFLAIVVLSLMVYYVRALASAHGEMVALLQEQLVLEGKDKVFLLQLFEKAMEQRSADRKFGSLRPRNGSRDLTPVGTLRKRTGGGGGSGGSSAEGSPQRSLGSLPRPQHQQGFRYLAN
ncbi:transmembrane channel-like protein 5 isoform X2 [Ixodes scapularis]|nr:transmembrane channel-like protein 5 isoform X2 [Ixodes scapularis]XP_040077484.1 transmembrane channel-like protein 5 isoform X2 [Ixodes scapularis]